MMRVSKVVESLGRIVPLGGRHKYSVLPEQSPDGEARTDTASGAWARRHRFALKSTMAAMSLAIVLYLALAFM